MISKEAQELVSLVKDSLLGVAALVTTIIAIYGVRLWKRELAGKEIYAAAKLLVKESHLVSRACTRARRPIEVHEKKIFSTEEVQHTTENERWQISEVEAYRARLNNFSASMESYQNALLEVRTLVGSKVYLAHLPFSKLMTEVVYKIGSYIATLQDHTALAFPDSPSVIEVQRELYPSEQLDDELTQKLGDAREELERSLLPYLHRSSIHG